MYSSIASVRLTSETKLPQQPPNLHIFGIAVVRKGSPWENVGSMGISMKREADGGVLRALPAKHPHPLSREIPMSQNVSSGLSLDFR
jgi:hypothetical protein